MRFKILLSIVLFITACSTAVYKKSFFKIGTIINLTIVSSESKAVKVATLIENEFTRIQSVFSPYKKSSIISQINNYAYKKPIICSKEVISLLKLSNRISTQTKGAFDISFAALGNIWDYKKKPFIPPTDSVVKSVKKLVDYKNIKIINDTYVSVAKGMRIGLGGIAKGYAIQNAVKLLLQNGIKSGIVEAGGDLQVIGSKGFNTTWKTGVIDPVSKNILCAITLEHMDAIATSGGYERYAEYKGRKYHHILSPRTGYPADTFLSVSVIAKNAVLADAYATALFVMSLDEVKGFLKQYNNVHAILIDKNRKIYMSSFLKDRLMYHDANKIIWL